ncbi:MAG TPA: hypothetical protein VEC17_02245 [Candidatus Binatia bacterium]|nr:hypothetical protein [Candidatus Binatia bacterium]
MVASKPVSGFQRPLNWDFKPSSTVAGLVPWESRSRRRFGLRPRTIFRSGFFLRPRLVSHIYNLLQ